jgi:hypothetical protein
MFFNKWVPRNLYIKEPDTMPKENEVIKNMTEQLKTGIKFDSEKPRWSLLPFESLFEVVEVLTLGAKKYAPDNWKYVPNAERRYVDAALRHFTSWIAGEKNDPETGKSHLAHVMCCLLFLIWFEKKK